MERRSLRFIPAFVAVVAVGAVATYWWQQKAGARALPDTIASANGRIEVQRVDISAKSPGRIAAVTVREGDMVSAGQSVATMDETEIRAELAAAKASVERAVQGIAQAHAAIAQREAELALAQVQLKRANDLRSKDFATAAEADQRLASRNVASAAVDAAQAALGDATAARKVAEANAERIEATISDMTLKAPVAGRVEYRLVQPGEVVTSGGKVVTLLDLTDVFMTVFLPTSSAGRVRLGSEARIVLDAAPEFVVPATVTFVAAEAQFTPKTVETQDERSKLMYRVKVGVPIPILVKYRDYVKSGLTGNAYIRLGADTAWPDWLQPRLPDGQS